MNVLEGFNDKFAASAGFPCETMLLDAGSLLEVSSEHDGRIFVVGLTRADGAVLRFEDVAGLVGRAVEQMKARFEAHDSSRP